MSKKHYLDILMTNELLLRHPIILNNFKLGNINIEGSKYLGYHITAPYDSSTYHIQQMVKNSMAATISLQNRIIIGHSLHYKTIPL